MNASKPALLSLKILIPVLILAISAWGLRALILSRDIPETTAVKRLTPLVETLTLQPSKQLIRVHGEGSVEPSVMSELSAQVAGRVEFVSPRLREGLSFEANEVLLRIEPTDYEVALAQSKAQLESANLALAQTEKDAALAKEEWERMKLDRSPDLLLLRIPHLAAARARLEAARQAVRKSELDLKRCEIRAPYAGRVLQRFADLGEIVQPGMRLAQVHSTASSEIRMSIHDRELAWLQLPSKLSEASLKQRPKVRISAQFGGKLHTWHGFVDRIAARLDPATRLVDLIVTVPQPYRRPASDKQFVLPLGLFVHMEIEGRQVQDLFRIPRSALRRGSQILLVEDAQRIHIQDVEILTGQREYVLVRGLRPGSELCITPIDLPIEGMKVRVSKGADR
ncbi:MAG: hypothetical protein CSA62_02510 [Planctomycetota bacterium]|nr:MAG: hypothetical protein CSA62_02510 [Planctomycetota bacterium]